jgi:hypothetical protein
MLASGALLFLAEAAKSYANPVFRLKMLLLLAEYACSEDNVDRDHLGFGPGPIRPDGTRGFMNPAPLPPPVKPVTASGK